VARPKLAHQPCVCASRLLPTGRAFARLIYKCSQKCTPCSVPKIGHLREPCLYRWVDSARMVPRACVPCSEAHATWGNRGASSLLLGLSPNTPPGKTEDTGGTGARRLGREGKALWGFLDSHSVEAPHTIAERTHRCGGLWRQRSQGPYSAKENCWVERGLSFRHPCRMRGQPTVAMLVEAGTCLYKSQGPALRWLTRQASLPVCSTP
jgi:hypothetical protein